MTRRAYIYDNRQILADLPHLKFLQKELTTSADTIKTLETQLARLRAQHEQLDGEINTLKSVTEVFEGVALVVSGAQAHTQRVTVFAADPATERSAEMYAIATERELPHPSFAGNLRDRRHMMSHEHFIGFGWGPREATHIAKAWVAHARKPDDDYHRLVAARFKIDRAYDMSKACIAAFEAAWLANADPDYRKMVATRFQLDRTCRTPKVRVDAFEAAWLAGNRDVAVALLTRGKVSSMKQLDEVAAP